MKRLDEKYMTAMTLLLAGKNVAETAEEVGISRRQLYRWMEKPLFSQTMNKMIVNNTKHKVSEVIDAIIKAAVEDRNAQAGRLILETHDLYKGADKLEFNVNNNEIDLEKIRAE
jgi:hypothetical protein